MLKPKDIQSNSTGATGLAEMMMDYTSGMDITHVELAKLHDAPKEWNFFKPLGEEKFLELCDSILQNGLIHPVIAFENEHQQLVLISGHNRKNAYRWLAEKTGDQGYNRIACVIKRGIGEDEARALLVDANWVQRSLTPSERAKAILYKYTNMGRKNRDAESKGKRTYDIVAEHFGLKATQVYQYTRLATLPEQWLRQVDEGSLSIKAAVYLSGLEDEDKIEIGLLSGNAPTTELVNRWQKKQQGLTEMKTIKRAVPEKLYDEIMDMIDEKVKSFFKDFGN